MWLEEPARSKRHFAMKVIALPWRCAISLHAVLQDHVAVGHGQRVGVADVDLLLARPPLALRVLDRDAGALQAGADRPHHPLFLGGLEDVVVLDIARRPS